MRVFERDSNLQRALAKRGLQRGDCGPGDGLDATASDWEAVDETF